MKMSLQCDETQVSIKDGLGGLKPARHYALVVVLSNAMNDVSRGKVSCSIGFVKYMRKKCRNEKWKFTLATAT